jgi:hypothetical protein
VQSRAGPGQRDGSRPRPARTPVLPWDPRWTARTGAAGPSESKAVAGPGRLRAVLNTGPGCGDTGAARCESSLEQCVLPRCAAAVAPGQALPASRDTALPHRIVLFIHRQVRLSPEHQYFTRELLRGRPVRYSHLTPIPKRFVHTSTGTSNTRNRRRTPIIWSISMIEREEVTTNEVAGIDATGLLVFSDEMQASMASINSTIELSVNEPGLTTINVLLYSSSISYRACASFPFLFMPFCLNGIPAECYSFCTFLRQCVCN